MNLNINEWKEFKLKHIFEISTTKLSIKDGLSEGKTPFISRTAENNGCDGYVEVKLEKIQKGNCLTIGAEGIYCFYQPNDFATGNKVYTLRNEKLNPQIALFIATILNKDDYKYSYGRARIKSKLEEEIIKLPIEYELNNDGTFKLDKDNNKIPKIDETHKYSKDGYIPDFKFMEDYIKSLNHKPLTTANVGGGSNYLSLDIKNWKEFLLCNLFDIDYGNKFDNNKMEHQNPTINFVSRTEKNNGVSNIVDIVKGIEPFEEGNMTIALGGSIGKCYVQTHPFYTGQNMVVCMTKHLSTETKIFISNIIMNEVKAKFCAFGRELNRHIKTDFSIQLPIQHNEDGTPKIDPTHKYSNEGFIPDWTFMEKYIKSLPYGDRI